MLIYLAINVLIIGVALCMKTSRGNEYQADKFSLFSGYAVNSEYYAGTYSDDVVYNESGADTDGVLPVK